LRTNTIATIVFEKGAAMDITSNSSSPGPVRGRPFPAGNPGRPSGSRNRSTVVVEALVDGEAQELLRKGIELAKAGDPTMLRFFLERLVPRDRKVRVDLPPLETAEDAVEALAVLAQAASEGGITPVEGASLSTPIVGFLRAIDVVELTRRVEALEAQVRSAPE
jgi:hypothetical protein